MNTPLVTIFTPVYNQREYIEETIESVLSQDYCNIEYIVIDDGSTDGTAEVLDKYIDRVTIVKHKNMGQYATVNNAFSRSSGEMIGIVNSDDPLLPGAVSRLVKELSEDKECLVVYPDWNMIDEKGNLIQEIETHDYSFANMVRWQHCFPGPAAFFRREVFEKLNGRNPEFRYIADFDYWLRAAMLGPFKRVPKTLATFRIHPHSITVSQKSVSMAREHVAVARQFFARKDLPVEIRKLKSEAMGSAYYIAGVVCSESSFVMCMWFFARSFFANPVKYFGEHRGRFEAIRYRLVVFVKKTLWLH